jgi:hypothetical protein
MNSLKIHLLFRFNFIAKKLFKRLAQLGAHELETLGLADDQHDLGSVNITKKIMACNFRSIYERA